MRRIFASGFTTVFVLSFTWIPSELNHSDKGSRFFDCNCDPSKSLLHVLTQRLTRTSPAQINDQNCTSPSPMHLGGVQIDLRSHLHESSANVPSIAPSDDVSSLAGRAAAVSTRWSHDPGAYDCIGQRSHGSLVPLTCCKLPPGSVGSHSMDESEVRGTPVGNDTKSCQAQESHEDL